MGVNASRVKHITDTDASAVLKALGTVTSTTTETAISLGELDEAYWMDGKEVPFGIIQVGIVVTACDAANADETYTLSLLVDDTSGLSDTPITVWSQAITRGFTGVLYATVDSDNIPLLDTDSSGTDKWLAVRATLGGTTPSLTYSAHIVKSIKG